MIHLTFYRVRPGKLDRLRAWLVEAMERADEVREAFVYEGVTHEKAFLLETADGHVLVAAVDCEDYDTARHLFSKSTFPIDVAQGEIIPELTDGELELAPLFDIRAPAPPGTVS